MGGGGGQPGGERALSRRRVRLLPLLAARGQGRPAARAHARLRHPARQAAQRPAAAQQAQRPRAHQRLGQHRPALTGHLERPRPRQHQQPRDHVRQRQVRQGVDRVPTAHRLQPQVQEHLSHVRSHQAVSVDRQLFALKFD